MRNLKFSLALLKTYPELQNANFLVNSWGSEDEDLCKTSGHVFVVSGARIYKLSLGDGECALIFDLTEAVSEKNVDPTSIRVVGIAYDLILSALIVCLESGELLALSVDVMADKVECFNSRFFESGFKLMEFSPDLEIGVCLTNKGSLIIISAEFQPLSEINLFESSEGEQQFINVGWGKKETQFHGSEGKNAAVAPPPTVNEGLIYDEHTTSITWRGNSTLFAVGYWCHEAKKRKVKIFSKDGVLQRMGEDLPGLEDPMAWRPTGNIALAQTLPNKYVISFMEKNGLKHYDFSLPSNIKVRKILWNRSSSIMCIVCKEPENNTETLMLWTTGNYHWYLKQKILFKSPPVCLAWDNSRGNRLHGVCSDGLCFTLEWVWSVDHSEGFKSVDPAYVAVIDNDKILLTSFQKAIIPPPMSQYCLQCPSAINCVLFPSKNSGNCDVEDSSLPCAVLDDGRLVFFSESSDSVQLKNIVDISWDEETPYLLPFSLNHWIWVSPQGLLICGSVEDNNSVICYVELSTEKAVARKVLQMNGVIVACSKYKKEVLLETSDGMLFVFDIEEKSVTPKLTLPAPCLELDYNSYGVFSLSEHDRLFLNGIQVANNVTSFFFHEPYLLGSTTNHYLLIVKPEEVSEKVSLRKLERGSKLIVASGNSVIMQLPRGNLETIQPRALTILNVGQLIDQKKYAEAMTLLKRQRIDLNLCVDHNPQQFLDDIELFVEQVDAQSITLLVTELSQYDVTRGCYELYYNQSSEREQVAEKVKEVCSALYSAMNISHLKNELLLPILSCLVKVNDMAKAIQLANTEQALKYLLFLVDVDRLYTEALAAYNLEAALKIAGKSLKDPKEYIPYLNSLKAMEPTYMKYTIDKTLRKPESALSHIAQCGDDRTEECFSLIKEYSLYKKALKIFKNSEERYKKTAALYGDNLYSRKAYEEAGVMYTRCGNIDKAIQSYMRVGNWRQCLSLANKSGYIEEQVKELAESVCNVLRSLKLYGEAAIVCIKYLGDIEQAVECYILGKLWQEAIYTAETYNSQHLLSNLIRDSLLETLEGLLEEIKQKDEKIKKHTTRLSIVRSEKLKRKATREADEMSDTQSETSSVSSVTSSMSRTSKNTRKTQRKLWSLKEGNPREEQALVATLNEIIQSSEKLTGEVHTTCLALVGFNQDDEAYKLQTVMKDLLNLIEQQKSTIWPKEPEGEVELDPQLKIVPTSCVLPSWELEIFRENSKS